MGNGNAFIMRRGSSSSMRKITTADCGTQNMTSYYEIYIPLSYFAEEGTYLLKLTYYYSYSNIPDWLYLGTHSSVIVNNTGGTISISTQYSNYPGIGSGGYYPVYKYQSNYTYVRVQLPNKLDQAGAEVSVTYELEGYISKFE